MKNKDQRALEVMERVLNRIKSEKYTQQVEVFFICSNGGIADMALTFQENGVFSLKDSKKQTDEPDKAIEIFQSMLNRIKDTRYNGVMNLEISCQSGRVYNAAITEKYNNLFYRGPVFEAGEV